MESLKLLLWVAAVVAVDIGLFLLVVSQSGDPSRWGQIGDAFGFANSVFSALGMVFVIQTLRLQQADMRRTNSQALLSILVRRRDEIVASMAALLDQQVKLGGLSRETPGFEVRLFLMAQQEVARLRALIQGHEAELQNLEDVRKRGLDNLNPNFVDEQIRSLEEGFKKNTAAALERHNDHLHRSTLLSELIDELVNLRNSQYTLESEAIAGRPNLPYTKAQTRWTQP